MPLTEATLDDGLIKMVNLYPLHIFQCRPLSLAEIK